MRPELYQQYSRTKVRSCVSTSWVHCPSRNWQSSEKRDRMSLQKSTGTITAIQRQQPSTALYLCNHFPPTSNNNSYTLVPIGSHTVCCLQITNTLYYTQFERNVPNNTSYFSSQLKRPSVTTCHTPLGIRYFCATTTTLTSVLRWCNVVLQLRSLE